MKIFGPYKTNKRASMQLSINAIVILVMAMAVLGLGLAMVRGLLGDGVTRLEDAIEGVNLRQTATAGEPLANINALSVSRRGTSSVFISFYNNDETNCDGDGNAAQMTLECIAPGTTTNIFDEDNSNELQVEAPRGQATTLGAQYTLKPSTDTLDITTGEYLCTISVLCGSGDLNEDDAVISQATTVRVES